MTRDDILRMAREAGLATDDRGRPNGYAEYCIRLPHFADLVAAAEREACREVLEDLIRTRAHLACNAREALSEASEVWTHHYHFAACQGAKCGCIDGYNHSPECVVEAAACQGWLNTPEAVDALLKVMVDRFLGWKLPKDFAPDCHVHFDREAADAFVESWPSGTNLLHAGQAMEMFKHCLPAELIISERAMGSRP